jgi:hypothetical protein
VKLSNPITGLNPVIENDNQINNKNKNMAKTATKTTKKVSTAKGKGKVVKKATTKKAAAKAPAVKKVKAPKVVSYDFKAPNKANPLPHFRYVNVTVSDVSNEKYPELVQLTAGPSRYSDILGKKYLNKDFAIKAINLAQAESLIGNGAKQAADELAELGFISPDAEVITPGFKEVNPSIMANEYGA